MGKQRMCPRLLFFFDPSKIERVIAFSLRLMEHILCLEQLYADLNKTQRRLGMRDLYKKCLQDICLNSLFISNFCESTIQIG